jgi:hypothetical protein
VCCNGDSKYSGAQIIPPHDSGIARCISENLAPWQSPYQTDMAHFLSNENFQVLTGDLAERYFQRMEDVSFSARPVPNPLKIAYTAMQ